ARPLKIARGRRFRERGVMFRSMSHPTISESRAQDKTTLFLVLLFSDLLVFSSRLLGVFGFQ
ncbi:MAG: hypothetical protein JJT96_19885, partial [Opitutales bacterium]|nr:hypothetical protein [Opitutales bacterium]